MRSPPLIVKVLAFRAWAVVSALWVAGTLGLIVWGGIGWDRATSAPYLGFVFGPPFGLFIAWHLLVWVLSPVFPERTFVLPSQDADLAWRLSIYETLLRYGRRAWGLLTVWLCLGWPILAGYHLYKEDTRANLWWFAISFFFGPILCGVLLFAGKLFLTWLVPEFPASLMEELEENHDG